MWGRYRDARVDGCPAKPDAVALGLVCGIRISAIDLNAALRQMVVLDTQLASHVVERRP